MNRVTHLGFLIMGLGALSPPWLLGEAGAGTFSKSEPPVGVKETTSTSSLKHTFGPVTSRKDPIPITELKIMSDRGVSVIHLEPHFSTTIVMPEKVSSINVGDPALFQAEHSAEEPHLVFIKPITETPAESNLTISTVSGKTTSLLLRSGSPGPIHFVVRFEALRSSFLIEDAARPSAVVPATVSLVSHSTAEDPPPVPEETSTHGRTLMRLLEQQQGSQPEHWVGKRLKVGIGDLYGQEQQIFLLFSVKNPSGHNLEVLPPQLQLSGKVKRGIGSAQQLPVEDYVLSQTRLKPGERGDGVVLFTKPAFKQSRETYYLQVGESSAVDVPALAPIDLNRSKSLKGGH